MDNEVLFPFYHVLDINELFNDNSVVDYESMNYDPLGRESNSNIVNDDTNEDISSNLKGTLSPKFGCF